MPENRLEGLKKKFHPSSFILHPLTLYALLAIVFTWPLVLHLRESVPGEDHRDAWQMVWNLWWVRHALENGQFPLHTDLLFYPQGTDLYLHALNLWNGLVSLPVQFLFGGAAQGAVAGYNFIVLLALTLGAFGAYRLALWLWEDRPAALLAGLAYGFCTYNFDHLLGHLNLVSSEFIPFYLLYFLKTLSPQERASWWSNAALAVLFLVFNTFLELQYVLYLGLFSLITLLYITIKYLWKRRAAILPLLYSRAAAIAGGFLVVTLPFTIPLLRDIGSNPNAVPERQDTIYSADLLAYFFPSPFHPLWGASMAQAIKPWTATLIEKVVFPGYTVYLLILAGLGLALWKKISLRPGQGNAQPEKVEKGVPASIPDPKLKTFEQFGLDFWLIIAAIFALISFGRRLHINGVEHGPALPGGLLFDLPILNVTRVPSRYAVIALLALGLAAAWGLTRLRQKVGGGWGYPALVAVAFVLLAFELLPAPYRLTTYNVPQFYRNLASDSSRYAILDLPISQYETAYMEAQMEHQKPLLGGYISRNPSYPPYEGVPVFRQFRNFETSAKPDILPAQPLSPDVLRYWGVRYVVVHNDLLSQGERDKLLSLAYKLFPGGPVYDKEGLTVFETAPGQPASFFSFNPVLPGWNEAESDGKGGVYRWAKGNEASLDFWTTQPRHLEMDLPVWSFNETRSLEIDLNGARLDSRQVGTDPQTIHLSLDLKPGQNRLTLKIGGRAIRPSDLAPGPDTRSLTLAAGSILFPTTTP